MEWVFGLTGAVVTVAAAYGSARIAGNMAAEASINSVHETFREQRQLDKERQDKTIDAILGVIYEELNILWELYDKEVGAFWKNFNSGEDKIFWSNISLTQDYFTVYRSNANLIGEIPDLHLRRKIVEIYTLLKALIDYYKQNNNLLDEIKENGITAETAESNKDYQDFTKRLNKCHLRFVGLKKELFDILEKKFPELNDQDPADDSP